MERGDEHDAIEDESALEREELELPDGRRLLLYSLVEEEG